MRNQFFTQFGSNKLVKHCLLLILVLACFSIRSSAQGDLLLYPKRVIFEGSKKSQSLSIANTGKDTVRYFISVVQIRMKEDGSFETINQPDSAQHFADKNFRFFPRNVVLGPNESQTVKMQLVNTDQLAPGEYRSHLYFRAEPEKKPLGEEAPKDTSSISVKLVAVFGISIPVIIRVGESTTSVSLANPSFEMTKDSIPSLKVTFKRTGNMSVYGDILVDHISDKGTVTRVGMAKGMAVYAPNPSRNFHLSLDTKARIDYKKGKLRLTYSTPADAKSETIAETEVIL